MFSGLVLKVVDKATEVAETAVMGIAFVEIAHFLLFEFGKTLLISTASSLAPWLLIAVIAWIIGNAVYEYVNDK